MAALDLREHGGRRHQLTPDHWSDGGNPFSPARQDRAARTPRQPPKSKQIRQSARSPKRHVLTEDADRAIGSSQRPFSRLFQATLTPAVAEPERSVSEKTSTTLRTAQPPWFSCNRLRREPPHVPEHQHPMDIRRLQPPPPTPAPKPQTIDPGSSKAGLGSLDPLVRQTESPEQMIPGPIR